DGIRDRNVTGVQTCALPICFQLAARNGIELEYASTEEVRASYQFDDLSSFLASYYAGMDVLRTEPDFFDLARTYFERVAAQNLRSEERRGGKESRVRAQTSQ